MEFRAVWESANIVLLSEKSVQIFAFCSPYTDAHGRGTGINGAAEIGGEDLCTVREQAA